MAVLKDTLIQGSARVTDTLYTTNIAGGKIIQPITWTADGLPEKGSSAEFFLAIDSFQNGGKTYWVSKANTLSAIGAATSGHNHNTTYLRLDGSNIMTGTLAIKPASGEGGELHLCASTANTTEAGIVLDHLSNSLRIFGIASADGTTKTGVGTPLVIDPYAKTITGGYTITGALTGHASSDLALTGGKMTGRIYREGVASNWHKGRDNSLVAISTKNGYSPLASMKTTNGSWEIGTYDNADFTDDLLFSYIKDTTYSGTTAKTDTQIRFYESGGALFVGQTTITYNPGATDSTAKGMINLTSSAPATVAKSGSYSWGINHLVPNLASGGHTCLITGMGNDFNNSAALEFNYVGSNSVNNTVGLGLYGNNQLLTINKAGTVKIKAATASTSKTTGALVVGGGIATGAASYLTGSVHIIGTAGSDALIVRGISGCYEDGNRGDPTTQPENTALYLNLNNGPIYLGGVSDTATDAIYMQYTQDASSSTTGAVRIGGGLGVAKKIYAGNSIIAGGSAAGVEINIKAISNAGEIYFWSGNSATGNRGIWLKNAGASLSSALLQVNQSNQITAMAPLVGNYILDVRGYSYWGSASRYIKDEILLNNARQRVGETWYDVGDATNVTMGRFYWREYSPNSTATTGTTGKYEDYYLPAVNVGRTDSPSYAIITTKNLGNISSVGTITSGIWNGSAIAVANGGTGATTAADARTNLGLGSIATYNVSNGSYHSTESRVPVVRGGDGVMEIGRYIDFHVDAASTKDYDARITATTSGLTLSGTTTGTFSGSLSGNATNVTGTVTYQHGGTGLTSLGSAGQVLKVNSSANGIEWGTVSTADEKVKVAANITTAADYPVVFANSNKSTTAAETAGLNKSGTKFYFNPSTGLLTATQVANAIWNDYAEYRKQLYTIQPGYVIKDTDSGYVVKANERLIPGAQIVSDTWGHSMGKTDECQTPVAVAGRVLAYTYRPRGQYHAGMAVCSAPGGTIDIMTREEIRDYPDAIIGIVSEIPDYEEWGSGKVKVDGRIWIKVR